MTVKFLLIGTALIAVAAPAGAAVTVIGSSAARMCYEAADKRTGSDRNMIDHCDAALRQKALSRYEVAATHVNRGILKFRLGNAEGAVQDYEAALAVDPNQPEAYLNKGVALIRQEDPDAAVPLFTMALNKKTSRPALAYYGRGVAHEQLGNLRSAFADYTRAAEEAPEWKEPRSDLARFVVKK